MTISWPLPSPRAGTLLQELQSRVEIRTSAKLHLPVHIADGFYAEVYSDCGTPTHRQQATAPLHPGLSQTYPGAAGMIRFACEMFVPSLTH